MVEYDDIIDILYSRARDKRATRCVHFSLAELIGVFFEAHVP